MTFKISCPRCHKSYAAENRWMGKRIRCKQCGEAFVVEAGATGSFGLPPAATVFSNPAVPSVARASSAGESPRSPAAQGLLEPDSELEKQESDSDSCSLLAGAPTEPMFRASVPQAFPMSTVVEAWLPLALGLIAVVWSGTQTFSSNETGRAWIGLLRIAIFACLYLLLISPLTYWAVCKNFKGRRRLLPPNPFSRVVATFSLPACLALVFWQVSGGIGGFLTGLIMGLVLVAAAFWVLFRLDPREAAHCYTRASVCFLVGALASVFVVIGANMAINRAMVEAHVWTFKESPLGSTLAWQVPSPPAHGLLPIPDERTKASGVEMVRAH